MVKFGERLQSLRQAGWEKHYLDYEALKTMIDAIANDVSPEAASTAFEKALKMEVIKVDTFVSDSTDEIRAAFTKATKQSSNVPSSKRALELSALEEKLSALRRFVGTNIIAATKIVKKHDKNVPPALCKREALGALIRSAPGMSKVPTLHSDVENSMKLFGTRKDVTLTIPTEATTRNSHDEEAEDEEGEDALRALPNWLLKGTEAAAKTHETFNKTFYVT